MKTENMKNYICVDANTAVGYIGYMMSEIAAIYPITPSSPMAEYLDLLASKNTKNIFGNTVRVIEMQSEAGAAGVVHGSACVGALATTYTASQGLLLMIPTMYKLAGEMLPVVFHVASRSLATHALNIFGDHSDFMAARQTGFAILASNNVQEAQDLAFISHIAALKTSIPFLHTFDGFRTSHEINKIEQLSTEIMKKMIPYDAIKKFKMESHNPDHPKQTGTAQNGDTFFQNRESCNSTYNEIYDIVVQTMNEFAKLTNRQYKPFEYIGPKNPEHIVIAMCSSCETLNNVISYINKKYNTNVGLICVHLYRPFNAKGLVELIPNSVKTITVLDRCKEPGAIGEPLYIDVFAALNENNRSEIKVYHGRYGLGGKNFSTTNALSIIENIISKKPKNNFTVGIIDDVTNLSLPEPKILEYCKPKIYESLFYGLGSDGTVSANKNTIKIIGDNTNNYVQGYFEYDSKKSGSVTISHLRYSKDPISCPYLIEKADFIGIHNYSFVHKYDILSKLNDHGVVLINVPFNVDRLALDLPTSFKSKLIEKQAQLYIINANKLAFECGLKNRINTIMETCFFRLSNVIDLDLAIKEIKNHTDKSYRHKGIEIIQNNFKAIDAALGDALIKVDINEISKVKSKPFNPYISDNKYFTNFIRPILALEGDKLPVSSFTKDGSVPTATSKYEKRTIANMVPVWDPKKCIQCGHCSLVCPHAAIRSYLVSDEDLKKAPSSLKYTKAIGIPGYNYVVLSSALDCAGCSSCVNVCPAHALEMKPINDVKEELMINYEFLNKLDQNVKTPFKYNTVKGIQFRQPYFEFSGACAGCGETPYIKLLTQLFGKNLLIANATGCSSIYGGSSPSCPYSIDKDNNGPSWANSLFENNAEFGYGMYAAINKNRTSAYDILNQLLNTNISDNLKKSINEMIAHKNEQENNLYTKNLVNALKNEKTSSENKVLIENAINNADLYTTKNVWMIGGDGWAYDIGFGGLDHVLASGENVKILVLDTEVYSNTGGQASKSTPKGATAKFSMNGKQTAKKDLGLIAMSYKNVYVAQISMGANYQQAINAFTEANNYDGPAIIIAYCPCINHGIDMGFSQLEEKKAVQSGYWHLYRYNPANIDKPMSVDSVEATIDYIEFIEGESRYKNLMNNNPNHAAELFNSSKDDANKRYQTYVDIKNDKDKQ